MSLTNLTASSGKKNLGRIDEGTFPARIVQIIDLGVQEDEYLGERKVGHKVFINFEFPTELVTVGDEDKPRWLGKEYTVSLHEKATLTKLIAAADPEGKATSKGRNMKGLLGLPLMVSIGSTEKGNPKISNVARLMKGLTVGELVNKSIFFDMDDGDVEQFNKLPQWMQDKIKGGLDFNDTGLAKALVGVDKVEYEATTAPIEDMVSDSPY